MADANVTVHGAGNGWDDSASGIIKQDTTTDKVGMGDVTAPVTALDVGGQIISKAGRGWTGTHTYGAAVDGPWNVPTTSRPTGTDLWSFDPTMTNAELAAYCGKTESEVSWATGTDAEGAPGGAAVKCVGNTMYIGPGYGAGFPFFPIENSSGLTDGATTASYYCEIWVKSVGADNVHYFGGQEYDHDMVTSGTRSYWGIGGITSPVSSGWMKYSRIITGRGTGSTTALEFNVDSHFFSPFLLLNYGGTTGYALISGAKFRRIDSDSGWIDNGTTVTLSTTSDKVGVGVTPTEALHVAGTVKADAVTAGQGIGDDNGYGFENWPNSAAGLQWDNTTGEVLLNAYSSVVIGVDTNDNDAGKFIVRTNPTPNLSGSAVDVLTADETGLVTITGAGETPSGALKIKGGPTPATATGFGHFYTKDVVYGAGNHCLHLDSNYTDSGSAAATVTTPGSSNAAAFDTSAKKFGAASSRLTTTPGSFIKIPGSSDLQFDGDFTVDLWVKLSSTMHTANEWYAFWGNTRTHASDRRGVGLLWYGTAYSSGPKFGIYIVNSAGDGEVTEVYYGTDMAHVDWVGEFNHVALCRKDGKMRMFVNGMMLDNAKPPLVTTGTVNAANDGITIGRNQYYSQIADDTANDDQDADMWVDEFRVVKGTALFGPDDYYPEQTRGELLFDLPEQAAPETITHVYVRNSRGTEKKIV